MSPCYLYLTISVTMVTLSRAAPRSERAVGEDTMELSEVLHKSVCPIEQVIDDDPNRIPRRIKMLKCAKSPNPVCLQQHMAHACCRHHHHSFSTECVEVIDRVLVAYRDEPEPVSVPVSVGCTCMIREATQVTEDT